MIEINLIMDKKLLIISAVLLSVVIVFALEGFNIPEISLFQDSNEIDFIISLNEKEDINFTGNNISVSMRGLFEGKLDNLNISTSLLNLTGFSGSVMVEDNNTIIDGSYERIDVSNSEITSENGRIVGEGNFIEISVNNISLSSIKFDSVSGDLKSNNASIVFNQEDVNFRGIKGDFVFNKGLKINGTFSHVEIPKSNISIG